jgi:hypothetical protein
MNLNDKKLNLISEGFTPSWVFSLNEGQVNLMYNRLVESKYGDKCACGCEKGTCKCGPECKKCDCGKQKQETKEAQITYDPKVPGDIEKAKQKGINLSADGKVTTSLEEKAVSQKQQEFFGVVRAMQKGKLPKKGKAGDAAKEMSKKDVKDFASTKHKGLPKKVESNEANYGDMIGKAMTTNMKNAVNTSKPNMGYDKLEENLTKLVKKNIHPKLTKEELMNTINRLMNEQPQTAEPEVKPDVDTPTKPDVHPQDDPLRPGRRTIPRPAPQAKKSDLPTWLQWNSISNKK